MIEAGRRPTGGANHAVCQGDMPAMKAEEIAAALALLDGWQVHDGHLHHTFRCRDLADAVGLVTQIAEIADDLNHHPDFCVTNKREVSVVIWTHKMKCLTALDFELAASITATFASRAAAVPT